MRRFNYLIWRIGHKIGITTVLEFKNTKKLDLNRKNIEVIRSFGVICGTESSTSTIKDKNAGSWY
jgi:hypothetical protein